MKRFILEFETKNFDDFLRGLVGGTKCARKNFTVSSGVAAQDGLIAVHQEDIMTLTAA